MSHQTFEHFADSIFNCFAWSKGKTELRGIRMINMAELHGKGEEHQVLEFRPYFEPEDNTGPERFVGFWYDSDGNEDETRMNKPQMNKFVSELEDAYGPIKSLNFDHNGDLYSVEAYVTGDPKQQIPEYQRWLQQ